MSSNNKSIVALVASRICHDLAGPISAISNGIELMQLTGADASSGPEIELVTDSVQNLTERLRLCRLAFGGASKEQNISISEMQSILSLLYQSRVRIEWDTADSEVHRLLGKAMMLAILCAETAIPMGGQITLSGSGNKWSVQASGEKVTPPDVWKMLDGGPEDTELPSSLCQFEVLPKVIAEDGGKLSTNIAGTQATIHITL